MAGDLSKRLLVLRFSALGDVAMTLPVVYSLARQYPDWKIFYATSPFFAKIFLKPPENLKVLPLDLKKDYKGFKGFFRLFAYLASIKPTCVADLHNVFRTWVIDSIFRMKGIPVEMADKMRSTRKDVISGKKSHPSIIQRYMEAFNRLGFNFKLDFSSLFIEDESKPMIVPERPAVGIAPFARYFNKTYPLEMTEKLIGLLTDKGINVYLFGARGNEAETLDTISEKFNGVRNLAGKFTIEEELKIMSSLDVMFSMDSANQHLASIAGTPVVSIWGSTTPACGFMAYNQNAENAMVSDIPCQPCTIAGSPVCKKGDLECFKMLKPETVAERIFKIISNHTRG